MSRSVLWDTIPATPIWANPSGDVTGSPYSAHRPQASCPTRPLRASHARDSPPKREPATRLAPHGSTRLLILSTEQDQLAMSWIQPASHPEPCLGVKIAQQTTKTQTNAYVLASQALWELILKAARGHGNTPMIRAAIENLERRL